MKKEKFDVFGMTCAACSSHIDKAVKNLSGVKMVNVNLLQNSMVVEFDEKVCSVSTILNAVLSAGYSASLKNSKPINKFDNNANNKSNLLKIIISFAFLFLVMYFSMGNMMWHWWVPNIFDFQKNPVGFALIQFILILPILFLNFSYFKIGFKNLFKGKPTMDSLIAVSVFVSVLYGISILFLLSYCQSMITASLSNSLIDVAYYENLVSLYKKSIYFESAGMILCFVSLGKFFENLSKKKTTKAIEKLIELSPKTATILVDDTEQEVAIENVKVNDIIIVKKGQIIPVDGEVVSGSASINESSITGEPISVEKKIKDFVYCSTIVESGYIKIKALKVGENTSISKVVKLVEEASNSKAPISKVADKVSGVFVPIVFAISFLTFIINLLVSHSFELSLEFAVTVIVIACPCALGLATPVAIMVGTGKGAENGLLIKNAEIMEKAHLIKTIVLDKTGTITEGKPTVTNFIQLNNDEKLLSVVYSMEKMSEHPLAKSIIEFAEEKKINLVEISEFEAIDGLGLKAKYNDETYYIGNYNLAINLGIEDDYAKSLVDLWISEAKIPLIIVKNNVITALIAVKDKIKQSSKKAISTLKQMGIKVVMLTGDNQITAKIIASQVGIDEVYAEVKPEQKLEILNKFKTDSKHLVAMVGDGVNDAPALSISDLSIAIGAGSEIAIETSDIVLQRNDLLDVVNAIKLSSRVLRTIKLGLFWAFFYNAICILVSTGVFYYGLGFKINPMIGTIAMSFSSVSVVLNALTINLFKPIKNTDSKMLCEKNDGVIIENTANNCEICCKNDIKEQNFKEKLKKGENKMEFYVNGMMCQNCQRHVKNALETNGVTVVEVNLESKKVTINTTKSKEEIFNIIKDAGYEATEK